MESFNLILLLASFGISSNQPLSIEAYPPNPILENEMVLAFEEMIKVEAEEFLADTDTIIAIPDYGLRMEYLEDESAYESFFINETIVLLEDSMTLEDMEVLFGDLDFKMVQVGGPITTPIYRFYLPGTRTVEDLDAKIEQIKAIPSVQMATYHRLGRMMTMPSMF